MGVPRSREPSEFRSLAPPASSGMDGDTPRRKPSLHEYNRPAHGLLGRAAPQQQEVLPRARWGFPAAKRPQASGGLERAAERGWAGRERPSCGCCQPRPWAWPHRSPGPHWAGHHPDPDPIPSHTALVNLCLVPTALSRYQGGILNGILSTLQPSPRKTDPMPSLLSAKEQLGFSPESGLVILKGEN